MTDAERDVKRLTRIEVARREAIRHGHPQWSHLTAYGPCTKRTMFK